MLAVRQMKEGVAATHIALDDTTTSSIGVSKPVASWEQQKLSRVWPSMYEHRLIVAVCGMLASVGESDWFIYCSVN